MQNIDDINIQPCIRSGYCCNKAPCYFGEVTSDINPSCKFLEGNSPGNYKCGKYDEIVAGMPENNAEFEPAFGAGCSSALNPVRLKMKGII